MSCLNLNKLLPATKAWKVFTNKVQSNLHKLNRSKTIKKPKNRHDKITKRISLSTLCSQRTRFKPKPKPSKTLGYHTHHFQRRPSAVYIDQLFIEPLQTPIKAAMVSKVYKETSSSSGKQDELGDQQQENMAATGEEDSADDMWESLALASPQMNGINERAEEFITRFRAEMRLQERLARRL